MSKIRSLIKKNGRGIVIVFLLAVVVLSASSCQVSRLVGVQALGQQAHYFNTPTSVGSALEQVSESVWTYHWYFDRTIIIDTSEGLVVVDPFSAELSRNLLEALHQAGINKPIHTLIYTHYHLDHTRGGSKLMPKNVICHTKCVQYWNKLPNEEVAEVLPPTQTIEGDATLRIGGMEIQLRYLGMSHTDTMYAVFLPEERVLFAADTVGIQSLLPAGGVSVFMPDYIRALEQLESLAFDTFVSSHFAWGSKADFQKAAQMQRDSWKWLKESIEVVDHGEIPILNNRKAMVMAYRRYYDQMKRKYGDWHGFDAQILATFLNGFIAYYIGS